MRLKLISCRVFTREMTAVVARARQTVEVQFLSMGLHNVGCVAMRERIQAAVDAVDATRFDAVLLGYGLCNNGLAGVEARAVPLILPRAHDCITLLLGSKERYLETFEQQPGTYFKSTGWIEHQAAGDELKQLSIAHRNSMTASFEELVAKYGEDNARYLWDELVNHTHHYSRMAFIEMGVEPDGRFEQQTREAATQRGWEFQKMRGHLGLLQRLVDGEWNESEFLIVPPGQAIAARYDEQIVHASIP
jgi:hypothetical protein